MSQFINKKENIVTEAIDGIVGASGGKLARLDGYPHTRVVIRNDWDKSKVALVSGGGSGHEPGHAGYVGRGMLTAAVGGDVFASPSVDAVLAGILAVTGSAGCLLIVKNYTGDRLNFGLAAERAKSYGLDVNIVIVDDDIALPDLPQARGLAGTLFVHKVAGALAENGADLKTVTATAELIVADTHSIGMSLDTCTVPGSPKENRIPTGMAELGLGIHGESGVEQIAFTDASSAMDAVLGKLSQYMNAEPYVALLNNLGGCSELEMLILLNELIKSSTDLSISFVVGPTPMMTSLDMRGFSVSVCPASAFNLEHLEAPCALIAWPGLNEIKPATVAAMPDGLAPISPLPSEHAQTRAFLLRSCQLFISLERELNALDAQSGDGDTGSTLAGAAHALIEALDRLPLSDHTQLYRAIGQELSQTMGGSSGVLLAIFFAATGDAASSGERTRESLQTGLRRMQQIGGANLGDRTLVDALAPALDALEQGIEEAAKAARAGANHTATILQAKAGRASYVSSRQLEGNVDPGAEAVARLFELLAASDPYAYTLSDSCHVE